MRILIIPIHRKLLACLVLCLLVLTCTVAAAVIHHNKYSQVFSDEDAHRLEIEKENSTLKNLFSSLLPNEQKTLFEDEYRNMFVNTGISPPSPLPAVPLSEVIARGFDTRFRILSHDPEYTRPVYDPYWRGAYFRGWLYLPDKNIEARHRIFAFSLGGSANYDIFGSLGYHPESLASAPIDNHRNINFLIHGFNVNGVKVFGNQVALVGKPKETGAQIVSIVQNDLLPEGVDTKSFLFQLSTPKGYEIDFLNQNILRYEYLMKEIEQHTVHPASVEENKSGSMEKMLRENAALKQELAFFIPQEDELIHQQLCEDTNMAKDDALDISAAVRQGKKLPFRSNYKNPRYKRPLYSPLWKTNYKRKWAYIPAQVESNLHNLHIIPQSSEARYDFFGTLGFYEKHPPVQQGCHGILVYNFDVSQAVVYKNNLFLLGSPSRSGAEVLSIASLDSGNGEGFFARLITPDGYQIDCRKLR